MLNWVIADGVDWVCVNVGVGIFCGEDVGPKKSKSISYKTGATLFVVYGVAAGVMLLCEIDGFEPC